MDNQKRENLLNLALDATEEERLKSVNLNVGYDPGEKTWELIVRYNGSLESLRDEGIRVDELAAGYAVLVVPESRIEQVSTMEQIVYIEKPKRLFFASNMARAASCLSTIQTSSGAGAGGAGTGGAGAGVISSLESGLTGLLSSGFQKSRRNHPHRAAGRPGQGPDLYQGGDQRRPGNRKPDIGPGPGSFHRSQRTRDSGGCHCSRQRQGGKRCLPRCCL